MSAYTLAPFDYLAAPDEELRRIYAHHIAIQRERLPADEPITFESYAAGARAVPDFIDRRAWMARDPSGAVVGRALLFLNNSGTNAHAANLLLDVAQAHRRRGLARRLLALAAGAARDAGRRLLLFETVGSIPAGAAVMGRLGARLGLEAHTNQLELAELDRDLLRRWRGRAAAGYELAFVDGPIPAELLAPMADLMRVMNSAPSGDLELEDQHLTAEQLRERERAHFSGGRRRVLAYVRERASGALAGYTEIGWTPGLPAILHQGDTGVLPEHRGRGLGKWLKAANLERALAEFPGARFVRTGNADSNAPMLAINRALGFKPYLDEAFWQLDVERALAYAGGGSS